MLQLSMFGSGKPRDCVQRLDSKMLEDGYIIKYFFHVNKSANPLNTI